MIRSNKLLLIGPGTGQHGMQCPVGPDCVAPCNLGHASVPAAAAGEMSLSLSSSAAAFNPPHKFCCVFVQFYGAGAGLFKMLRSWSLSAAGPDTFLCLCGCVLACMRVCTSGLIITWNLLLMKTLWDLCRPRTLLSCILACCVKQVSRTMRHHCSIYCCSATDKVKKQMMILPVICLFSWLYWSDVFFSLSIGCWFSANVSSICIRIWKALEHVVFGGCLAESVEVRATIGWLDRWTTASFWALRQREHVSCHFWHVVHILLHLCHSAVNNSCHSWLAPLSALFHSEMSSNLLCFFPLSEHYRWKLLTS